jgi:ssDNA-binding Zn-finger/Zn-ribbon topoisomerase 1
VNRNSFSSLQFNSSALRFWITLIAVIWLLGAIGLGWLVKSVFILLGLLLLIPVAAFFALPWWLKRNLVEDQCPVCQYKSTYLNGKQFRCPNCSEPLQVQQGRFHRLTPPGTVDVEVVEVSARRLDD